jgi:hypothetical protein
MAIWERRSLFLSQKVRATYLGYAMAQLKRIKTHRSWLLNPPRKKPMREDFDLPGRSTLNADDRNRIEEAIAAKLRGWSIDDLDMPKATRIALKDRLEEFWTDILGLKGSDEGIEERIRSHAAESLGLPGELFEVLNRERRYRAAQKHWESYQRWKTERNPHRAQLEARHGYDTKHAMHLIRLMRTGLELLETGTVRVRRPDAAELIALREGALTYDQLFEEAARLEGLLEGAVESSPLPPQPDAEAIDALLARVIQQFSRQSGK